MGVVGELLGDGSLRVSNGYGKDGTLKGNARFLISVGA
jgi:hypothetical protein